MSSSFLGGLVHGYAQSRSDAAKQALDARTAQRNQMMSTLQSMATNQDLPEEHRQWAMQQGLILAQHDMSKPLPKGVGDISTMPAAMQQNPARQAVTQTPGMTLTAPNAPAITTPTPPSGVPAAGQIAMPAPPPSFNMTAPPPPPGDEVGRTSSGTVNALGAASGPAQTSSSPAGPLASLLPQAPGLLSPPSPSPAAASTSGAGPSGPPLTVPGAPLAPPVTLPPGPRTVVQNPTPPTQLSPAGQFHLLTPEEKAMRNINVTQAAINRLQQQYPDKSPEDLAYFAQHGEFPRPGMHVIDGKLINDQGKVIYDSAPANAGQPESAQYEPVLGMKGVIGIKRVGKGFGGMLTDAEVAADPRAQAIMAQAQKRHSDQMDEDNKRDMQKEARVESMVQRRADLAVRKTVITGAVTAANKIKTMVDLLNTQTDYVNGVNAGSAQPTPRQDLSLIIAAVRAMNPGTVRLPQKELELELKAGSYGDRFKRQYDTATAGTLPADQRNDLFNVVRNETTQSANSAADSWRDSLAGTTESEPPTWLRRFGTSASGGTAPASPRAPAPRGGGGGNLPTPTPPPQAGANTAAPNTPQPPPTPDTHDWSAGGWRATHPNATPADVEKAKAAARKAGYRVVN